MKQYPKNILCNDAHFWSIFPLIAFSLFASSVFVYSQSTTATKQEAEAIPDYIRYIAATEEGNETDRLQTAISRFQRGNKTVDLIAVVHVADGEYYERMNEYLTQYNRVYYELVGGAYDKDRAREASTESSGIQAMQNMIKDMLALDFQLEGINYEAANFVHADVNWNQYEELMTARNQSFSTLLMRAMNLANSGELGGLLPGEDGGDEAAGNMLTGIMGAVLSGDSTTMKRELGAFISEAETLITKIEGDDGTVIVSERNKVVMDILRRDLRAAADPVVVAIFYGAAHMPDFEKRLIQDGFQKTGTAWATAWKINDQAPGAQGTPPAVNLLNHLLEENPEVMNLLGDVTKMLEDVQKGFDPQLKKDRDN